MKKLLALAIFMMFALSNSSFGFALPDQIVNPLTGTMAPDFTLTDIDGTTHSLYADYLDQGQIVILQVSAGWSSPDWNYVQTGALETIYNEYGPDGTGEMMVLFAEADSLTSDDCLSGLEPCAGMGTLETLNNWVDAMSYPIIAGDQGPTLIDLYSIYYFPTILMIFPSGLVVEVGQMSAEQLLEFAADNPYIPVGDNNVVVSNDLIYTDLFCGSLAPSFQFHNKGALELTSFDADLSVNGTVVQSTTWTGNLASLQYATIDFDPIEALGDVELTLTVSNPNGASDDDDSNNSWTTEVVAPFFTYGQEFTVSLIPDGFVQELSIYVYDPNEDLVYQASGAAGDFETGELFFLDFNDLDLTIPGCYSLVIEDIFGDGIFPNGNLVISNNGTVIVDNPGFANELIVPFYNQFEYDYGATAVAFHDENGNGELDAGESPLLNQAFALTPTNDISFTNAEGNTTFVLDANTDYNIEWQGDLLWDVVGDASVAFTTDETAYDETFYFPMTPNASIVSHELDLSSSITRCNWDVNYWLTYTNSGTTINSGYLMLIPDELATFANAIPAPDSTAGDTLYWYYEGLLPSYSEQIVAQFSMPNVDFINESIGFSAEVETWESAGNRKAQIASELVCAYDPNDKLVSPNLYGGDEKNYTLFNDSLEYTVRFQNTGNDTAFTVLISDELDVNLDLSTFRVISSSHEVVTNINVDTRIATFLFEDIYLPDSFVNEPGSHGFVKYKIEANEGLAESTVIDNTAGIYFDLNDPIITNTVANTMVSSLPTLPVISASPNDLDFGYVALGETGKQTLTIINPGDLTLEITEIISETNEFTVINSPYTIAGGGEVNIEVEFTPSQETPYIGNIILKSNVGNLPVTLQGIGGTNTGIQNLDWRLSVAPNPSNGLFELNWLDESSLQNANIQVYDVSGKLILRQEMNGNNSRLNLNGQAKGVYYLSLQTEQTTIIKKLVLN